MCKKFFCIAILVAVLLLVAPSSVAANLASEDDYPGVYFNDTTSGDSDFRAGVEDDLFVISIDTNSDNARTDDEHMDDNDHAFVVNSAGSVGIGTKEIPVGTKGMANLAIHDSDTASVQFTTDEDDYPVLSAYAFRHDLFVLDFDKYHDGSDNYSSDAGSCARITKTLDSIKIRRTSGISQGTAISAVMPTVLDLSLTDGSVKLPEVYSDEITSMNYRDLYIDDDGKLGYISSSIRYKENIRDLQPSDTSWLYALRPVIYDYNTPDGGTDQIGLIAEEVEIVNPEIVSYKRELTYPAATASEPDYAVEPVVVTTDIPETVSYSKLVVPMLSELQNLRSEVDAARAELSNLRAKISR